MPLLSFEQTDLSKYPVYEVNFLFRILVEKYKKILRENQKKAFDDELYKWQALSECNGKNVEEVFSYFLKDEGKNGAKNLFYYMGLGLLKPFVNEPEFKNIFENLFDENISLDKRLEKYKNYVKKLISDENKILPNDERSASVFLACHNPQKYTFYKGSYYGKLCDFLNEPKQKAGQKYSHYLKLVEKLEKYIDSDSELLTIFGKLTAGYLQSQKLIVQNILYVMFEIFPEKIEEIKSMTDKSSPLIDNLTDLLQHTHNLIFHGAPGTGKTFLAKEIAEKMGCTQDEIGFVQFHPSYDYTDFVEGLRPKSQNNGEIGFERKDGVFKEFCKRALPMHFLEKAYKEKTEFDTRDYEEIRSFYTFTIKSIDKKKDNIDISVKGEKQTFPNSVKISYLYELLSNSNFINNPEEIKGKFPNIEKMSEIFYFYLYKKLNRKFLFIIDEINRGELSKIFGELFYAVEPGYRVSYDDLKKHQSGEKMISTIRTQYANLETEGNEFDKALRVSNPSDYGHFFIPENVYIIGTMNDIDRSVDIMDFAFRRRFAFREIKASENLEMLSTLGEIADEAENRLKKLNDEISEITELSSPSSYHIGGAYFLKLKDFEGDTNERFQKLWTYHLEGLLKEYLRGTENAEENFEKLKDAYFGLGSTIINNSEEEGE